MKYKTQKGKDTDYAGYLSEMKVKKHLEDLGYTVDYINSKYDLLVNNFIRIEVKSSKTIYNKKGKESWMFTSPRYTEGYDVLAVVLGNEKKDSKILFMKQDIATILFKRQYGFTLTSNTEQGKHRLSCFEKDFNKLDIQEGYKSIKELIEFVKDANEELNNTTNKKRKEITITLPIK